MLCLRGVVKNNGTLRDRRSGESFVGLCKVQKYLQVLFRDVGFLVTKGNVMAFLRHLNTEYDCEVPVAVLRIVKINSSVTECFPPGGCMTAAKFTLD